MPSCQKGFGFILFFLVITIISGAIIGGSFYIRYSQMRKNSTVGNSGNQLINFSNSTSTPLSTKDKIIFETYDNYPNIDHPLKVSKTDGSNVVAFDPSLDKVGVSMGAEPSSDCSKLFAITLDKDTYNSILANFLKLIEASPSAKMADPNFLDKIDTALATTKNQGIVYNINGQSQEQIDLHNVKSKIGNYQVLHFHGWSADGNQLMFLATNQDSSYSQQVDQAIAAYDIKSGVIQTLVSKKVYEMYANFLDPVKKYFIYSADSDQSFSRDLNAYVVNLEDNHETKFDRIIPKDPYGNINNLFGKYFAKVVESNTSNTGRRTLQIYSIYDLTRPISTINLAGAPNLYYGYSYWWSQKGDLLAYLVSQDTGNLAKSDDYLYVYNIQGQQIIAIDLKDQTRSNNFQYEQAVFSPDEKKILLSNRDTKSSQSAGFTESWREYNLSSGSEILKPTTTDSLGVPLCWVQG